MIRNAELKQLDPRDKQITDRLLRAAELVFAEKGLEKATLREITRLAEVNLAAVSYYFGSKSDLALAVFDELSIRLNERRLADLESNLAEAKQAGRAPDLRSILTIFIRPYVETGKSGRLFARLVMQHRVAPSDLTKAIVQRHFDPMAKRFIQGIAQAAAHLDPSELFWRYVFMIGSVVYSVADLGVLDRTALLSEGKVDISDDREFREAMINFLVGGMMWDSHGPKAMAKPAPPRRPVKAAKRS
jgi:AcrR family transcriptional regulator